MGETAGEPDEESGVRRPADTGLAGIDLEALTHALRSPIDHEAVRQAICQASSIDYEAVARAVEAAAQIDAGQVLRSLRMALPPEAVVVPEDDEDLLEDDDSTESSAPPPDLAELAQELQELGVEVETHGTGDASELRLSIPAGRSSRPVVISNEALHEVNASELAQWRSLERYDGLWSAALGRLAIAIRGERFGPSPRMFFDRGGEWTAAVSESGIELSIEEAHGTTAVLLAPRRFRPRFRQLILNVRGLDLRTTVEADDLAEAICDSVFFDLDLRLGLKLGPRRLESRTARPRGMHRRSERSLTAPTNRYVHAPILLYRAGRDRVTAPLIRYWSLYQVLEYFFPQFVEQEALRQLSRILRSPGFDVHRDIDVLRAVEAVSRLSGSTLPELDQLRLTLRAITTTEEMRIVIHRSGAEDQLRDKKSPLSNKVVTLGQEASLLEQLAHRIYDIRCSIVHSKSHSVRSPGPGLLPETDEDDLIREELPIMEFLAQQALVATSDRLALPSSKSTDEASLEG